MHSVLAIEVFSISKFSSTVDAVIVVINGMILRLQKTHNTSQGRAQGDIFSREANCVA